MRTAGLRLWARLSLLAITWLACDGFALGGEGGGGVAAAQGLDFTATREAPIEVLAEQGIEWQQDSKSLTARGNARLSRGDVTVRADALMAYYRERSRGTAEVYRVQATGHVRITSPTQAAFGNIAEYNVDDRLLRLIGCPARLETPMETLTAYDVIEYHEAQQSVMARGDVHVSTREGRTLQADVITADLLSRGLRNEEQRQEKMTRLTANGRVRIETAEEVIRGEHGTYDTETGLATLTGSVKITRGDNQLNGEYAVVNLKTGWGRLYAVVPGPERQGRTESGGRVRLLFVPEKQDGGRDAGKTNGRTLPSISPRN